MSKEDNGGVVLDSSSEAAAYRTDIKGWVSRNGRYCGQDERLARYYGCTHVACEDCCKPIKKTYTVCQECRGKREVERYLAMPKQEWDREGFVYSQVADEYFDSDQLAEHCEENELTPDDLRLVICEPNYAREIDTDYFADDLPEEVDLPREIWVALDALNKVIREFRTPLSWSPGKFSAVVKP